MTTAARGLRIVIGAGGTGGHIYPGLATADAIRRLRPDATVTFSGAHGGLEATLVPAGGYAIETVPMRPLSRAADAALLRFPLDVARSVRTTRSRLRRARVDAVLGMGGYPSVPAVLAARLLGIPTLVHESNAVPGLANTLAALVTRRVATGFDPGDARWCRGGEVRHVGVPLHTRLASADDAALRREARQAFRLAPHERLVVVSGGSLGAQRLDRAAVDLAIRWRARTDLRIVLKARSGDVDALRAEAEAASVADRIQVLPYLDRMGLAYAAAAVVVMRAGSGTIAELEHLAVPAVLVPYPHATGDHQTHNARALVAGGARAAVLPDDGCTGAALADAIDGLLAGDDLVRRPGPGRHADAADELARWVVDLAEQHHPGTRRGATEPRRRRRT